MSREEGIGLVERARGETLRRYGQRRSGQHSRVEGEVEGTDKFQKKSVTLIDHVRNHGLSF